MNSSVHNQGVVKFAHHPKEDATWGDHPSLSSKKQEIFRVVFNNVNGISPDKARTIALHVKKLQIDLLGMAETNTQWSFQNIEENCVSAFRTCWSTGTLKHATSASDHNFDKRFQPGGTMSIVGDPWAASSTMRSDATNLGRWTECEISGKEKRCVVFISAYNVCRGTVTRAGLSAYSQQYHLLLLQDPDSSPDPRKKFNDDLKQRIIDLKNDGKEVVVMMDANDTFKSKSFTNWFESLQLVDVHTSRHGLEDAPATYKKGPNRIDYMFATTTISNYVKRCGILSFNEICKTDHRALYADFDLSGYLKGVNLLQDKGLQLNALTISGENRSRSNDNPCLVLKVTSPASIQGKTYVLEQSVSDKLTIGSGEPSNKETSRWIRFTATIHQIEAKHASVSLVVARSCGTLMVQVHDLNSSTGTYVRGKRIPKGEKEMAFCNHSIRMGNVTFLVTNSVN